VLRSATNERTPPAVIPATASRNHRVEARHDDGLLDLLTVMRAI
jgi:hypothetical protein